MTKSLRLTALLLLFSLITTPLRSIPLETPADTGTDETTPVETPADSSETDMVPVITDDLPKGPPPQIDSEHASLKRYKTTAAVVIATIATITLGLLISGADTGKKAPSS